MTQSNLPPGCSNSDIPGNRPEDMDWEKFHEEVDNWASREGISCRMARLLWGIGLASLSFIEAEMTFEFNRGYEEGKMEASREMDEADEDDGPL